MYNARSAFARTITIGGTDYELLCLPGITDGTEVYNFYLAPSDGSQPFCDMFGLPSGQQSMEEAFDIAEANAPDYIEDICEGIEPAKRYNVKPEYLTLWGDEVTEDTIITANDVIDLAQEWEKPVEELLGQLIEID